MTNSIRTGVLLGAATLLAAGVAAAQPTPASLSCASAKQKAIGKDIGAKLKCWAKAATTGAAVDPLCLQKSEDKTIAAFDKADAKGGCPTDGASTTATIADANEYVNEAAAAMLPTPGPSKCASKKIGAAGKLAAGLLNCESKAAKKNTPVDQVKCVQKAIDKTVAGFLKEDTKAGNDCLTTGDGASEAGRATAVQSTLRIDIPRFNGCGNGLTIAPETCDDGNTSDGDFCPSDCHVEFCNPLAGVTRQVTITASTPDIAAIELSLDYPEGKISLPGTGTSIPAGTVVTGGTASVEVNDFDHALKLVSFDAFDFGTNTVAIAQFEDCSGAIAPVAGDFTCSVSVASDENLAPVSGVTCAVTLP